MSRLNGEKCVACRRDSPRVTEAEIAELRFEIPDWELVERDGIQQLERVFRFPDFAGALAFTNRVGALAEEEGHHPSLLIEWGRVTVNPAGLVNQGWRIVYTPRAQKDSRKLARSGLRPRAEKLLALLARDPFEVPPPFEKLLGDLKGAY